MHETRRELRLPGQLFSARNTFHSTAHVATMLALACVLPTLSTARVVPSALIQTRPFDDGHSSLAVEGLILTRYALGLTGAPLVAATGISAVDATTVEASINCAVLQAKHYRQRIARGGGRDHRFAKAGGFCE